MRDLLFDLNNATDLTVYRVRQNKRPHYKNCSIFKTAEEFLLTISSVIEDIIRHNQRTFCKVLLFHA